MLFSSSVFLFLFLPVVLFGYYVVFRKWRLGQNLFLFLASLFFYAWGEPWFVLVMLGSIVLNYFLGLWAGHVYSQGGAGRIFIVLGALFVNLGIIFVFKYLDFFIGNFNALLHLSLPMTGIELPIGISFFTFQSISYVLDVLRGKGQAQKNPLNVGLYVAFFPQLIAGPIVRYETIAEELQHRKETWSDLAEGICRFIVGLGKKVLIANSLAVIADEAIAKAAGSGLTVSFAWLGAISYVLQLYFDFSGYSDMAIGLGRMFGFHFLENFDYPLTAKSLAAVWRRWHISLGAWFQDYVYFPMGGSRVSKGRTAWNLFVVWLLTGLWHGANWTFLVWGMYYYVFLCLEKFTPLKGFLKRHSAWASVYTLFFFCIGEIMFRADTLSIGVTCIASMLGFGANGWGDPETWFYLWEYKWFFLAGVVCATPVFRSLRRRTDRLERMPKWMDAGYALALLVILVVSVSYIVKGTYNPFIYFNF
ncbi:MAG: MBOAT family protein [Oscillospiraceae bacterium]|nr:MBOAT family protein [Oscillospiraceae bacterium]